MGDYIDFSIVITQFLEVVEHVAKSDTISGVFWRYADCTLPFFPGVWDTYASDYLNERFRGGLYCRRYLMTVFGLVPD